MFLALFGKTSFRLLDLEIDLFVIENDIKSPK